MKHIYLNLKRFDVPAELGGVNRIADVREWGSYIVKETQEELKKYNQEDVEFAMFFPEIHLFSAQVQKQMTARCRLDARVYFEMMCSQEEILGHLQREDQQLL